MARRLIGLDVGTNAVTIAEVTPGTPPRLDLFAQVALARSAMREGEIADEAAVTDAVTRLRNEVGIKKVPVRVGIASPRVVVRQVEMPVMSRDELAGALQFQAGDLIPIPIDDAVLDFAILGTSPSGGENGEPTMQVLLAAAYQATVSRLVSAVEAGGLTVAAVDLVPLALTRALARPVPALARVGAEGDAHGEGAPGAEGIVSFGGGVTSIAVHEAGIARFVRVIGSGGRELTDAIATDLNVPAETAEALKRQVGMPSNDELVARARTSIDRPLSVLLDEVRSSIDYYRNQPGAARLLRVVATGGSAQLPGIPERLSALVGVPVEHASMRDLLRVGNIGFSPDELPRIEPYLPAAVGLALGGAGVGTVIDLLPRARKTAKKARPQFDKRIVLAGAAALVLLGGLTYLGEQKVSSAQSKQSKAEANVKKLESAIARLTPAPGAGGSAASLQAEALALLQANVGWPHSIGSVGKALPSGVWLTAFQGQQSAAPVAAAVSSPASAGTTSGDNGATATAGASPTGTGVTALGASGLCAELSGTITMSGIATDLPTLSHFLDNMKSNKAITNVWVASAQKADFGTQSMITFTANATLGDGARSARIADFFKGASCK
jgi:type IV pilus assembly protein PilM